MPLVVFLKGVNVGGHRRFRPSVLAKKLSKYGVTNIGAAGTFVVAKPMSQARLRAELRRGLPFEVEAMICSANDVINLASGDPFLGELGGPQIVRFVSVLAKRPRVQPALPLCLPSSEDWLVKVVTIRGRFVFGYYRRMMRTISLLSQLERRLGGSATTRNWNTIATTIEALRACAKSFRKSPAEPSTKS
jgi:uncharacterized protein (DUF1697 family)